MREYFDLVKRVTVLEIDEGEVPDAFDPVAFMLHVVRDVDRENCRDLMFWREAAESQIERALKAEAELAEARKYRMPKMFCWLYDCGIKYVVNAPRWNRIVK